MNRIKNSLAACAGLALVIALVALATPPRTRGQGGGNQLPLPVNVVNTAAAPVPVRDVDNPARQPIHTNVFCVPNSRPGCEGIIYTVPAGKRLVIEYASVLAEIPPGQVAAWSINTFVGGRLERHRFPLTQPSVAFDNVNATEAGQQVRIYADPGTNVTAGGNAGGIADSGTPSFTFTFTISGYLVNVPQ